MNNEFKDKLARKVRHEFPDTADYKFWARFKKESGPIPFVIKAWAPIFMLVVVSLIGLSVYHSPQKNAEILTFQSKAMIETEQEMLNWVLEMDEENEEFFAMGTNDDLNIWQELEEVN
jgi:hypothetical protein